MKSFSQRVVLIDNYDSFVYNLARYFNELGAQTVVVRNDAISAADLIAAQPAAIVISPGPCDPERAGISMEVIRQCGSQTPLLGVCLGHQAIAAAWGGRVIRAPLPMHGRSSELVHSGTGLFAGLSQPLRVGRYHSLLVDEATLPHRLTVIARTTDGLPMALADREAPVWGVQFHPESVLTEQGHQLLANFLTLAGLTHSLTATWPSQIEPVLHAGQLLKPASTTLEPEPESTWWSAEPGLSDSAFPELF